MLGIGDGPQFLAIDGDASGQPGIVHMGLAVDGFDAKQMFQTLNALEETSSERLGPTKTRIETRGAGQSGAPADTLELLLEDPAGISIQLQDSSFCGGGGRLGNQYLSQPEPAKKKGVLKIQDFNHFTSFVGDPIPTVAFYRQVFQLPIDTYQGAMPLLRVGQGNQFLAFANPGGRNDFQAFIHHVCFSVKAFNLESVLQKLAGFGIEHRDVGRGPVMPLQSFVTMRMPDRGGAAQGTPELYFTDPDGILLQIQDARYSGGGGVLGNRRGQSSKPTAGRSQ
ncbi:MAG: VOC family protein [Pirellulaceae bacterium]|nr:VOC family protein [Pirellulaceae bacterium]